MASITKRGKTWAYRVYYYDEGKRKYVSKSGFKTKAEAKDASILKENELLVGKNVSKEQMLLADYMENWKKLYKEDTVSMKSISRINSIISYVRENYNIPLRDITHENYQSFLNDVAKTRSKETVKKYHTYVKAAIKHALRTQTLLHDPTTTAVLKGLEEKNKKVENKYLSKHEFDELEKALLEEFCFGVKANSKNCAGAKLNANIVGKSAAWIAEQAGFSVPEGTNILAAECKEVGEKEPLTREKLSPVLALLKSNSTEQGLELAEAMVNFYGLGHSAAIHTQNAELAKTFGERVKAIRVIWNSPSTFGGIGDVYNSFLPSLTLGCGSYGKNSVGNNVSAVNLINIKRVGRRRNNMQWFKVPSKIYFERDSIQYLKSMNDVHKVMIVTDRSMVDLGFVDRITEQLRLRRNKVMIQLFTDVEPNPSLQTVQRGTELMRSFQPDTIIALGGGSPMDAAKIMWLFYEQPEVDFRDLVQKFMDIRKRAFKFPQLGRKAKFVGIPTTSGTGSEVTPFAVITDGDIKYPLADYSLTPTIAIVDPALVMSVPAHVAADTGLDVLTHATEAYTSILANDYTDGLALQAIKLVFENLEKSVKEFDETAREKMHNASTMAGMAFANAFLGICHSMAHKIGGKFHTIHGRTNAILLPHVIRYNGTRPTKVATWPKYTNYVADIRFQDIARMLGLPASTPEEAVESYAKAVHDLAIRCGVKMSLRDQGVDEKEFIGSLRELALNAFEDQCTPANPRLAMIEDMEELMRKAYYGE